MCDTRVRERKKERKRERERERETLLKIGSVMKWRRKGGGGSRETTNDSMTAAALAADGGDGSGIGWIDKESDERGIHTCTKRNVQTRSKLIREGNGLDEDAEGGARRTAARGDYTEDDDDDETDDESEDNGSASNDVHVIRRTSSLPAPTSRWGETNETTRDIVPAVSGRSSAEAEVWQAVSSLPWQRQSRKNRRLVEKDKSLARVRRSMSSSSATSSGRDIACSNSTMPASTPATSAENEVVLQRLMSIFARADWSTDISSPSRSSRKGDNMHRSYATKSMSTNKVRQHKEEDDDEGRGGHIKSRATNQNPSSFPESMDSPEFTEIEIGSPLTPAPRHPRAHRAANVTPTSSGFSMRIARVFSRTPRRRNIGTDSYARTDNASDVKTNGNEDEYTDEVVARNVARESQTPVSWAHGKPHRMESQQRRHQAQSRQSPVFASSTSTTSSLTTLPTSATGSTTKMSTSSFISSPGAWLFSALRSPATNATPMTTSTSDWRRRSTPVGLSASLTSPSISTPSSSMTTTPHATSVRKQRHATEKEIKDRAARLLDRVGCLRKSRRKCAEVGHQSAFSLAVSTSSSSSSSSLLSSFTSPQRRNGDTPSHSRDFFRLASTPARRNKIWSASDEDASSMAPKTVSPFDRGRDSNGAESRALFTGEFEYELCEFWVGCIVPNWSLFVGATNENKMTCARSPYSGVGRLWREGLPENARQYLWPLALGNELKITEELFDICCKQSRRNSSDIELSSLWQLTSSLLSSMELDIQRTVDESHLSPTLKGRANMKRDMLMVLEAFAQYRPDVGYVQGMTYISAVLLLYLDPAMAFICFVNLVSQDIFLSFFRFSSKRRDAFLTSIGVIVAAQHADMSAHLESLGITPDMYMVEWLVTLFARTLRFECITRLWDCYMLDGVSAIYRATLSVMTVLKPSIMAATSLEDCLPVLKAGPRSITEAELFDAYSVVDINPDDVSYLTKITGECYSPRPVEYLSRHGHISMRVRVRGSISPKKASPRADDPLRHSSDAAYSVTKMSPSPAQRVLLSGSQRQ